MGLLSKYRQAVRNGKQMKVKKYFPEQKHIINYAFSVLHKDYYKFDDVFQLPYERGLMALAIYEETRMKCTREYLEEHTKAIEAILKENPIDIYKINELNEQMKQRLDMVIDVDLLYKLASVVFFDKNENPCTYEAEYNAKKIEFWKKNKGVADFFLQKPLQELIPFLQSPEIDLQRYSELNRKLNNLHSERLQLLGSKKQ